jgi:ethanolamine ammonia-lyase small subunit
MLDAFWEWVFAIVGGTIVFLINLLRGRLDDMRQENELLDQRMRQLEMDCVKEDKVRQLIDDALSPVKAIQGEIKKVIQGEIKEDIRESKQDIKELLRLQMQRRSSDSED